MRVTRCGAAVARDAGPSAPPPPLDGAAPAWCTRGAPRGRRGHASSRQADRCDASVVRGSHRPGQSVGRWGAGDWRLEAGVRGIPMGSGRRRGTQIFVSRAARGFGPSRLSALPLPRKAFRRGRRVRGIPTRCDEEDANASPPRPARRSSRAPPRPETPARPLPAPLRGSGKGRDEERNASQVDDAQERVRPVTGDSGPRADVSPRRHPPAPPRHHWTYLPP